jgi:hypothetical protein
MVFTFRKDASLVSWEGCEVCITPKGDDSLGNDISYVVSLYNSVQNFFTAHKERRVGGAHVPNMQNILKNHGELAIFVSFLLGAFLALILAKAVQSENVHFGCGTNEFENSIDPGRRCKETHVVFEESSTHRVMKMRLAPGQFTRVHRLHGSIFGAIQDGILTVCTINRGTVGCRLTNGEMFSLPKGVYKFRNDGTEWLSVFVYESCLSLDLVDDILDSKYHGTTSQKHKSAKKIITRPLEIIYCG